MAQSIEEILGIPFSLTVRALSVNWQIRKRLYVLGRSLLYLSALLAVGEETSDGPSTYTKFQIATLGNVRVLQSKNALYRQWFWSEISETLGNIVASWPEGHTFRTFGIVAVKPPVGSMEGLSIATGPGECRISVRKNGDILGERCCLQL